MMKIHGYSWAGVPTEDFEGTNRFFEEVLGLEMLFRNEERMIGIFKLPTGQLFEVFGPGNRYQALLKSPAIGFDVDDIEGAVAELEARGVKFVSEIEHGSGGAAWTTFEGPDGHLYQLFQPQG
jgi:predicted enzyme related to lactoylglutathione lyase